MLNKELFLQVLDKNDADVSLEKEKKDAPLINKGKKDPVHINQAVTFQPFSMCLM